MPATFSTDIIGTFIYAIIGSIIFIVVIVAIEKVTKFSIQKEIVEDGNIAVAIVLAAVIASLGMIVSSAIH